MSRALSTILLITLCALSANGQPNTSLVGELIHDMSYRGAIYRATAFIEGFDPKSVNSKSDVGVAILTDSLGHLITAAHIVTQRLGTGPATTRIWPLIKVRYLQFEFDSSKGLSVPSQIEKTASVLSIDTLGDIATLKIDSLKATTSFFWLQWDAQVRETDPTYFFQPGRDSTGSLLHALFREVNGQVTGRRNYDSLRIDGRVLSGDFYSMGLLHLTGDSGSPIMCRSWKTIVAMLIAGVENSIGSPAEREIAYAVPVSRLAQAADDVGSITGPRDPMDICKEAVFKIEAQIGDWTGTGFVIDSNGIAVTCSDVVRNGFAVTHHESVYVSYAAKIFDKAAGKKLRKTSQGWARVVWWEPDRKIAILKLPIAPEFTWPDPLPMQSYSACAAGDSVLISGFSIVSQQGDGFEATSSRCRSTPRVDPAGSRPSVPIGNQFILTGGNNLRNMEGSLVFDLKTRRVVGMRIGGRTDDSRRIRNENIIATSMDEISGVYRRYRMQMSLSSEPQ